MQRYMQDVYHILLSLKVKIAINNVDNLILNCNNYYIILYDSSRNNYCFSVLH